MLPRDDARTLSQPLRAENFASDRTDEFFARFF
jgi:hypothetical protein